MTISILQLMAGLLHLVERGRAWVGCGPASHLLTVPNVTAHPATAIIIRCGTVITVAFTRVSTSSFSSLLRGQRQAHCPSAGMAESQMPSPLSWGIGRAATL